MQSNIFYTRENLINFVCNLVEQSLYYKKKVNHKILLHSLALIVV